MTLRHKVFISYHHANDQLQKERFVEAYGRFFESFVDRSVGDGDIPDHLSVDEITRRIRNEFMADATVTIVLVGRETWKRKHVDWEIYSSLRHTMANPRMGLLGILLPGAPRGDEWTYPNRATYDRHRIPPRLWDNIACGYAEMRPYPTSPVELQDWIHQAFLRRNRQPDPDLSRPRFARNRAGERWSD